MQAPVYLTRKARFCAAHRYHNPAWSDARNQEAFGPCNNRYGHGHNYELEVTVAGQPDAETGMLIELTQLDHVIDEHVVQRLDHRHLNEELPEWRTRIPTAENLVRDLWNRLEPALERPHCHLHRLRLKECDDLFADYYGERRDSR
jgi:6-pyruvoyltetrahydropterin/6-carboxytetrahydropterin synthase